MGKSPEPFFLLSPSSVYVEGVGTGDVVLTFSGSGGRAALAHTYRLAVAALFSLKSRAVYIESSVAAATMMSEPARARSRGRLS